MRLFLPVTLALLLATADLAAQDSLRYIRVHFRDKGTPDRILVQGDSLYTAASAHLTPRALARRVKVMTAGELVSTADLPVYQPWLDEIAATGAQVVQTSRWLNTAMVLADSAQREAITALPFLDSVVLVRTRRRSDPPHSSDKRGGIEHVPDVIQPCIDDRYGQSAAQNRMIGVDVAHRIGFSGEGVFVGILDAGTQWRMHEALKRLNVVAERDFVYGDDTVDDQPGEQRANDHGTHVLSILAGAYDGTLIGVAPHATIALARTEDIRSERHVEEDNYVAGLEWLESLGVDLTNTSLGYTDFDAGEQTHGYEELNGRTAHASRGVNEAVKRGMVCVIAAGNEGSKWYRYVSVPGEADSAIAAAALTPAGNVASFSSRWFGNSNRVKPNLAAPGVGVWHAESNTASQVSSGQGTSYASPMTTGAAALLLSARPSLRPWELRDLMQSTASRASNPDTAVGYGTINLRAAIEKLSTTAPVIGRPRARIVGDELLVYAWTEYRGPDLQAVQTVISLRPVNGSSPPGQAITQPRVGLGTWRFPLSSFNPLPVPGSLVDCDITSNVTGDTLMSTRITIEGDGVAPAGSWDRTISTLCFQPSMEPTAIADVIPNPFVTHTFMQYQISERARVTLSIYNSLGQEVSRPVDSEEQDAGYHTLEFDAAGMESGMFWLALRVGGTVVTRQMVHIAD